MPNEGTSEVVAWGIADNGRLLASYTCEDAESAREITARFLASGLAATVVPLYRSPTLTDAEREAVEVAVEYVGSAFQVEHHAATLRGLLKRLG